MNHYISELRAKTENLEMELNEAKEELVRLVKSCRHDWRPPILTEVYHESYMTAGDPPGTMGVDWRGPVHVPSNTTKHWSRTCNICGDKQYTAKTKQKIVEHPEF